MVPPPIAESLYLPHDIQQSAPSPWSNRALAATGRRTRVEPDENLADLNLGALSLPRVDGPFPFTRAMHLLCEDIVERVVEFAHINMRRVLTTFVACRGPSRHGVQAKLTPMRFDEGRLRRRLRGREYQIQRIYVGRAEILYVLSFYLPRFLKQSFEEKIVTVFHELYHIHPHFDGSVRRMGDGRSVHGRSRRAFDQAMAELARGYFRKDPPRERFDFLRLSPRGLEARYGGVVGVRIPTPKLLPVRTLPGR